MRNMGFRLAAGSVKTARRRCARRRVVLTGSAASSTIVAGGNGSLDLNKGTFLSRTKGDIFIEARHRTRRRCRRRNVLCRTPRGTRQPGAQAASGMSRYVLTAEAQHDLRQIRDHVLNEGGFRAALLNRVDCRRFSCAWKNTRSGT